MLLGKNGRLRASRQFCFKIFIIPAIVIASAEIYPLEVKIMWKMVQFQLSGHFAHVSSFDGRCSVEGDPLERGDIYNIVAFYKNRITLSWNYLIRKIRLL